MPVFTSAAFVSLSFVTLAITALLRRVLQDVVAIDRRQRQPPSNLSERTITMLPDFEGVSVDQRRFRRSDVMPPPNQLASLVFVDPSAYDRPERQRLGCVLTRIAADTPSRVHVVCMDSAENCRALASEVLGAKITMPFIIDSDRAISTLFHVDRRVFAVYVASDGRIIKRGGEIARNASYVPPSP